MAAFLEKLSQSWKLMDLYFTLKSDGDGCPSRHSLTRHDWFGVHKVTLRLALHGRLAPQSTRVQSRMMT
jgi:hypothetical protein